MKLKKRFSLLCAAAIALSAVGGLPAAAEAGGETAEAEAASQIETYVASDFTYWANDTRITITGYTGNAEILEIPGVIDGYPVTSIGYEAFKGCESLTSITIPDGVTEIGMSVFSGCKSLTSITIPNSVTKIGVLAFSDCTSLTNITIPDSVTKIFHRAFTGCTSLTSITIPNSVTEIQTQVFSGCKSLTEITVDSGNPSFMSVSGILYSKDGKRLLQYPAGKSGNEFTVPDDVILIDVGAFEDCENLTSITIPDGVTTIGMDTFLGSSLISITIPNSVTEIQPMAFGTHDFTIYGYAGSYAETYANENNIPFVDLTVLSVPQNVRNDENSLIWDEVEGADGYEVSFSGEDSVIKCDTNRYDINGLENGSYTVKVRAMNNRGKVSDYSEPFSFVKYKEGLFDKENELETPLPPIPTPEPDKITSITINPAFNMKNKNDMNVELDLTKIKIKAQEIYDEEGLKRAEEALGEEIIGNKHYNLLDLTLLYNDQDFSNGYDGLVQVIIPLPTGHRDKTFSCYRLIEVNGEMTKEVIPGEQTEDSYIIYLEHFSEYALVADGGETPAPAKQGFYSDGSSILTAEIGMTVTQKTEVKDGKQDVRFIQKVNAAALNGKSKATFTLTANGVTKEVSTTKYYTGLTFDDGTKATAASGQVFLCYTVTDVPENVTVEATSVVLE